MEYKTRRMKDGTGNTFQNGPTQGAVHCMKMKQALNLLAGQDQRTD